MLQVEMMKDILYFNPIIVLFLTFNSINNNHILSAIIYNKIADLNFANELHSSKSFKFFTFFSNLYS